MLNKTAINKQVVQKVVNGCREALTNESGLSYATNKKGKPFLRIKRVVNKEGKIAFEVLDKSNNNIAPSITGSVVSGNKGAKLFKKDYVFDLNQFILNRVAYPHEIA